jgi:hypothetical protein
MCSKSGMAARGAAIGITFSFYPRSYKVGGTRFSKDNFGSWAVLLKVFRNAMESPASSYGATLEWVNETGK